MTFEAALYTELTTNDVVFAIVSDRVQPVLFKVPIKNDSTQEVHPFIVFALSEASVEHTIDNEPVTVNDRWAIHACSGRYDEMLDLAAAIITCLDGFNGLLGGSSGVSANVSLESYSDDADNDLGLYVRRLVFTSTHEL